MYMVYILRNGDTYSWSTDLGNSFFNSFACNGLFSPFFLPYIFLPEKAISWALFVMTLVKFALAGGGAYLWIHGWIKSEKWAMLAALLYAFSGQMIYNVIYFFFLDSFALFPYAMASLDDLAIRKKKGIYVLAVAVYAATNYMFFTETVVFVLLYYVCMLLFKVYPKDYKSFLSFLWESICGTGLAAFVILPSTIYMLQTPRATSKLLGTDLLFYSSTETYLSIIKGMFLLPDRAGLNNLFSSNSLLWTSTSTYLPAIGISGFIVLLLFNKKHPLSKFMLVCVVFAFVPILNSSFLLFNAQYYARWYFMPVLILCGATAVSLSDDTARTNIMPRVAFAVMLITASFSIFPLLPAKNADQGIKIGVVENQLYYWLFLGVSLLGTFLFWREINKKLTSEQSFSNLVMIVFFIGVLGGMLHYTTVITDVGNVDNYNASAKDCIGELRTYLSDESMSNARVDYYGGGAGINIGLWVHRSSIQSYSSTVSPSTITFYRGLNITRDVASVIDPQLYGLRGLLSVKYEIVANSKLDDWESEISSPDIDDSSSTLIAFLNGDEKYAFQPTHLDGWTEVFKTTNYTIYENLNFVPMGFSYDYYLTESQFDNVVQHLKPNSLMKD